MGRYKEMFRRKGLRCLDLQIKTTRLTPRNGKNRLKLRKSMIFAVFRAKGKLDEFYAILRGSRTCIKSFIPTNNER